MVCVRYAPALAKGRHAPVLAGRFELGSSELEADALRALDLDAAVHDEGARRRESDHVLQAL